MVGNDVVDLLDPESDAATLHPAFDSRVFNGDESDSIACSSDPSRQRWRLWAAKEAAYKLVKKLDPSVVFSPVKFAVALAADHSGRVDFASFRLPVRLVEAVDSIHVLAFEATRSGADLIQGLVRLSEPLGDPAVLSRAVRALAISRVAEKLGFDPAELEIRREGRVPRLLRAGRPSGLDLSLSHHGECVGFVCSVEERDRVAHENAPIVFGPTKSFA